jgi:hypothetical protein
MKARTRLLLLPLLAHSAVAATLFQVAAPEEMPVNRTVSAVFFFLNTNPLDLQFVSAYQTDVVFSSNLSAQSITELGDFATQGIGLSGYFIDNPNSRISGLLEALTSGGGLTGGALFQIDFLPTQAGPAFVSFDGLLVVDFNFNFVDATHVPSIFTILPEGEPFPRVEEIPEPGGLILGGLGIAGLAVRRWRLCRMARLESPGPCRGSRFLEKPRPSNRASHG